MCQDLLYVSIKIKEYGIILYLEYSGYELWLYSVEEPGGGPELLRVARAPRAGRAQLAHLHHPVRLHVQSEQRARHPTSIPSTITLPLHILYVQQLISRLLL
jgi:hypothetical protein